MHGDRCWSSPAAEIDHILDSQRRYKAMLADIDVFYSRSDLRMFVDQCRAKARAKLLAAYDQESSTAAPREDLVLHAAAKIQVSPLNVAQLIEDYPGLVRRASRGSLPLHVAATAQGAEHLERLKPLLDAYPEAIATKDEHGLVPMQIALLHEADADAVKLLVDSFPPALEYRFLPLPSAPAAYQLLVGLLPFHLACCCGCSLDVIFRLLLERPDVVSTACSEQVLPSESGREQMIG